VPRGLNLAESGAPAWRKSVLCFIATVETHAIQRPANRYLLAAFCVLLFLLGQALQQLAHRFWIPSPDDPASALLDDINHVD
jgi:hypothetical protein